MYVFLRVVNITQFGWHICRFSAVGYIFNVVWLWVTIAVVTDRQLHKVSRLVHCWWLKRNMYARSTEIVCAVLSFMLHIIWKLFNFETSFVVCSACHWQWHRQALKSGWAQRVWGTEVPQWGPGADREPRWGWSQICTDSLQLANAFLCRFVAESILHLPNPPPQKT